MSRGGGDKVEEIQLNPFFIINHILISRVTRAIWEVIFAKGAEAKALQEAKLTLKVVSKTSVLFLSKNN